MIAQTVYSNNFDTPAVALPGLVATFSGGASIATDPVYFPTYGNIWRDGSPSPDNLDMWVDGARKGSYTYNNASGTIKDIGGGTLIARYVQFESPPREPCSVWA